MNTRLIILMVLIAIPCAGQSRLETRLRALAEIETGTKDLAIGRAGEVSRYQISPGVWIQYSHLPQTAAVNPFTARNVVIKIMADRTHGQIVTDSQWYLLFHRPARVNCPKPDERDRAERFSALCRRWREQPAIKPAKPGLN